MEKRRSRFLFRLGLTAIAIVVIVFSYRYRVLRETEFHSFGRGTISVSGVDAKKDLDQRIQSWLTKEGFTKTSPKQFHGTYKGSPLIQVTIDDSHAWTGPVGDADPEHSNCHIRLTHCWKIPLSTTNYRERMKILFEEFDKRLEEWQDKTADDRAEWSFLNNEEWDARRTRILR